MEKEYENESRKNFYIDVSILYITDAGTGIQRVTRAITSALLNNPPTGYHVQPVHGRWDQKCYYSADNLFNKEKRDVHAEHAILMQKGDIFLGLDLNLDIKNFHEYFYQMHERGAKIYFVIYDLIPLLHPEWCNSASGIANLYLEWLPFITRFDGVICISKTVAAEVIAQMQNGRLGIGSCPVKYFWLGSNIEDSLPSTGLPEESATILEQLKKHPTVLLVSTIEPRKGHRQALAAFEQLWARGSQINLVFVGRRGWEMDDFITKLKSHPQKGIYLFWLQGISDEYLERIYESATVVLVASEAEGFGLSIVEAIHHGKPLILRDIPVFREIAGEHAWYFGGNDPSSLATALESWFMCNAKNAVPSSQEIPVLTWDKSAQMLLDCLPLTSFE